MSHAPLTPEEAPHRTADRLLVGGLGLLPQNALSRLVGAIAGVPVPRQLRRPVLGALARRVGIELEEAELPLEDYRSFGDLFVRRLRPGSRPVDPRPGVVVSPCDGTLGQCGRVEDGTLLQVKGRPYSLVRFLADPEVATDFSRGSFLTIYLSPRNYHRVHSPVDGSITGFQYLPGRLFPVNRAGVHLVDELFAVNERVATYLDGGSLGKVALVMVGATSVGRIAMAYDDIVSNRHGQRVPVRRNYDRPRPVARGEEVGAFHLGSTVVLLFARDDLRLLVGGAGTPVRMGEAIGAFSG